MFDVKHHVSVKIDTGIPRKRSTNDQSDGSTRCDSFVQPCQSWSLSFGALKAVTILAESWAGVRRRCYALFVGLLCVHPVGLQYWMCRKEASHRKYTHTHTHSPLLSP